MFFFTKISFAQEIVIKGTVKDALSKHPIEGVTIGYDKGLNHIHTTAGGHFLIQIKTLPTTLLINRVGYKNYQRQINTAKDTVIIWLQPEQMDLNQVEINHADFRKQVMEVDLNKVPVNSAQDLLRKVPGLFIAQHAGGGKAEQIFLRGFDNDHGTDIRITADGIPVNMVSHAHGQGYADLHFIIPETVENIDAGKGAYYADKGNFNTAGYVDFSTYNRLENSLFKVEAGAFNTKRAVALINVLNPDERGKNLYVAGEFNYTDGPFNIKQNLNRINVFAKYNQWLDSKRYINLQASTFSSGWNASGQIPERAVAAGLINRWGSIDPTEGGSTARNNLSFTYKYLINNDENWESQLFYSRYKFNLFSNFTFYLNDPVNGDGIQQTDDRNIYGMENKYTRKFVSGNSRFFWKSGFGMRFDDIKNLQLSHVYYRDLLLNRLSDVSVVETNLHAYTSLDWQLGKFTINPGLRADHFIFNLHNRLVSIPPAQDAQATRVSPKLNFSYTPNRNIQWYLKTGMGFHSNDARVVIEQKGKEILPFSAGGDLGALIRPLPNLIIQPAIWYTYLQQEFVYVGDEAVVEPSGKTQRLGADLGLRYQPLKWLYIDADINYAHARFLNEPKGKNYIPLVPSLTSTGGISVKLPNGFSANMRYRYMKSKPALEDYSVVAKGYFINDLLLAYEIKRWQFTLQAQNVFNTQWNEAQFETETKLKTETEAVSELHYTPGTPFFWRAGINFKF